MRYALVALGLLAMSGMAHAQANCSLASAPRALPIQPTFLPALSPELTVPSHQLGAPTGVLAQAYDESQTVDNVLFRLKLEGCRSIANAKPAASPGSGVIDSSTYKPKTEFDNTPWRFDMNQNGKRMTAEEFDQWMKSRGVRVAKGSGAAAAAPAPASSTAAPATATPATTTPNPTPAGTPPGTPTKP